VGEARYLGVNMEFRPEEPHAIVLSGGGANAAYEVGVLKALTSGTSSVTNHYALEPAIYTGTSAGAFNAAILTSWSDYPASAATEYLEQLWLTQIAWGPEHCGNGFYRIRGDVRGLFDPACGVDPAGEAVAVLDDAVHLGADSLRHATAARRRLASFRYRKKRDSNPKRPSGSGRTARISAIHPRTCASCGRAGSVIFDTDVLIWFFRGDRNAKSSIESESGRAISIVSLMELFQGARSVAEIAIIRRFFPAAGVRIIAISEAISHLAATLMEECSVRAGLHVTDALIAATARESGETLVTGNVRHFRAVPQLEWNAFRPVATKRS
jgi:predicted nucleic acid-binding protein